MGCRMKTTIELSDAVLLAAKDVAARQGTTLRRVVEAALRGYLDEQTARANHHYALRRHAYGGNGLRTEAAEAGWERIRELSYEGRGS